eukprot:CAMPEP_0170542726 /NCGR_PEP_ID=MMETSP0211-20121228/2067_1 /TAXON_ID=311385 /ORGANISM="Pseudokeronopsis sp., Strain OXSARD2" /LENGTH=130 /DNA_ID=CAMNT_0010845887 /DNA_START=274 /DNA_END=666 /DNA_ORIENTATION=+
MSIIEERLDEWAGSKFQRHKCKQRLTKLHQMIRRQRKIKVSAMHTQEELVTINKKYEKREAKREVRAEAAALDRPGYREGAPGAAEVSTFYPKEIYNLNQQAFEKAIDEQEIQETEYNVDEEEDYEDDSD